MKRFTTEGRNEPGRELIPAPRNAEEAPLGLSFEGGVAGARTFSRHQALGLLGGSLVGVSLLSFGLATPANAATPCGLSWCITRPGGGPGVAPVLSAAKFGSWWDLTLKWTCVFAPEQQNHKFGTNWTLMESDDTSAEDVVAATVAPNLHSATSGTATFIPSQKANPAAVNFTHTRTWHEDDLDTELGGEEIYVNVRLKDFTLMTPSDTYRSSVLNISP